MPTKHVRLWAKNAFVGVRHLAAETLGIRQAKSGLTTQPTDNKVREHVWEITQSRSISSKLAAGTNQWDLTIDRCITRLSDLASKRLLWKSYFVDKTILNSQKLRAENGQFPGIGVHRKKNGIDEIPTKKTKFVHIGIDFIALTLLLLFLIMSSATCKIVWKSQLNNSATLNSHTDAFRCFQVLPDRLSAKRWALRCSETTSPVLLIVLEDVEQNTRISWRMYGWLRNATKSNQWHVPIWELLGVLAESQRLFRCILNLEPYSPGVIIKMFISNSTIQLSIFLLHTLIQAL